jgi:hypothetical protein
MTARYAQYQKPESLLELTPITIDRLRVELSQRLHSLANSRSTGAFTDMALCYFEPWLIYEVAVEMMPTLHWGDAPEFTMQRRHVIESVVAKLRRAGAVEDGVLWTPDHYCGKFRVCLGRGCATPKYLDLYLVPIRPEFFWGKKFPGVADINEVINRRRLTGLADLRWVAPINRKGGLS